MSANIRRKPALQRRVDPVAGAIPDRISATPPAAPAHESLTASLQVRVRPSTRARLERGLNKLRFERNDRSVSLSSITDEALDAWLTEQGL